MNFERIPFPWLRRFCGKYIAENPFLHELGFRPGRSIWRSLFGVLILFSLISPLTVVVPFVLDWVRLVNLHGPLDGSVYPLVLSMKSVPQITQAFFVIPVILLPLWRIARSWGRDANPGVRDQIAASPLTVEHLLAARIYIWSLPFLIFAGLNGLVVIGSQLLVICFVSDDSYLWYGVLTALKPDGSRFLLAVARVLTHFPLGRFGWWFFTAAVLTRIMLIKFRWDIALAAALGFNICLVLVFIQLDRWVWGIHTKIGDAWTIAVNGLVEDGILLILAMLAWRGLRSQVARVYNLRQTSK